MRTLPSILLVFSLALLVACGDDSSTTDAPDDMGPADTGGMVDLGPPDLPSDIPTGRVCVPDTTLGEICEDNGDCDDGCDCNGVEECSGRLCVAGDPLCQNENRCVITTCDEEAEGDKCVYELDDTECDDGNACNGTEVCNQEVGCISGTPLFCDDDDTCTFNECDNALGCVYTPVDLDGDGFIAERCGGEDCDDDPRFGGPMTNPDAPEVCDNGRDDDCDGFRDFRDPDCDPSNTDCATATLLPGAGTYSGSTRRLDDTTALSCSPGGRDAFFTFTLTTVQDVRVSASGPQAAVALRNNASCETDEDIRCSVGTSPEIFLRSVEPGSYTIVVTQTGTNDVFDLVLRFEDATTPPPIDVCAGPPDGVDVSAGGSFMGMFLDTADDYELSCGSVGGGDEAAYFFDLPPTGNFDVELRATGIGGAFREDNIAVSLVTDCDDNETELGCTNTPGSANLSLRDVAPGRYFVLVERQFPSITSWTLDVTITPIAARIPGDSCNVAVDLTPPMGMTTRSGTSALAGTPMPGFDGGVTCNPAAARDAYFEFTLDATQDVRVTTDVGFSSHSAALMDTCGDTATERRCTTRTGIQTQLFRSLPAGTYFVVIATGATFGTANASIEILPPTTPPANEICSGATVLTGPTSTISAVDLTGYQRDEPGCRGGTNNVDAFYEFTLAAPSFVTVSAVPAMGTDPLNLTLTLRDACGTTVNRACETGMMGTGPSITQALAAGTYVVVAEAPELVASTFDLSFTAIATP